MRPTLLRPTCLLLLLAAVAAPAAAQHLGVATAGLRAGLGDDPHQVVFGFAVDLGEVAPRLRLQPSLDLATGDDGFGSVGLLVPVHYRFPPLGALNPYAGGGLQVAYLDPGDNAPGAGGNDFDIAPVAVGGFDFPLGRGTGLQRLSVELELGGGSGYDARVVFGVMF
jgi:hypothetical protein